MRHIRTEWQQWIEWDYKKVSVLCGGQSVAHNTGIPGVTEIDPSEWCQRCAMICYHLIVGLDGTGEVTSPLVKQLYQEAFIAVSPGYEAWAKAENIRRERRRAMIADRKHRETQ